MTLGTDILTCGINISPLITELSHTGTRLSIRYFCYYCKKTILEMIQSSIVINRLLFCCIHCSVYMFFFRLCYIVVVLWCRWSLCLSIFCLVSALRHLTSLVNNDNNRQYQQSSQYANDYVQAHLCIMNILLLMILKHRPSPFNFLFDDQFQMQSLWLF